MILILIFSVIGPSLQVDQNILDGEADEVDGDESNLLDE